MPQRRLAPADERRGRRRGRPDRRGAVDGRARRRVARPLLAAAEEGLGVTHLVQVPPRRALGALDSIRRRDGVDAYRRQCGCLHALAPGRSEVHGEAFHDFAGQFQEWAVAHIAFSHAEADHLFTNMIGLYFFGTSIANKFGPAFLLKLYIAGALAGSTFFLLEKAFVAPRKQAYVGWDNSRAPALGASAAVNAIILLEIFLYPKRLVYLYFFIPIPAAFMGAALIGADLWRVKKEQGGVSGSAHLGGALVAALTWAYVVWS